MPSPCATGEERRGAAFPPSQSTSVLYEQFAGLERGTGVIKLQQACSECLKCVQIPQHSSCDAFLCLSFGRQNRSRRPKVPQAQFSSSTAVRESGSAVAVVLASRQIGSAVGGDTETPAG